MKHLKLFEEFQLDKIKLLKGAYEVVDKLFPPEDFGRDVKSLMLKDEIVIPFSEPIGCYSLVAVPFAKFKQANLYYSAMINYGENDEFVHGKMPENVNILIVSTRGKINVKGLEDFFPKQITGGYGKNTYTLDLDIDNMTSVIERKPHSYPGYYTSKEISDPVLQDFVLVSYETTVTQDASLSIDTIQQLPVYKEIVNSGYKMISNASLLKKNTLSFAFPVENLTPPKPLNEEWFKLVGTGTGKYLDSGWALYGTGYLRTIPVGTAGGQPAVAGKFEADNLEGWKVGLTMLKEKIEKKKKGLIKRGVVMEDHAVQTPVPSEKILALPEYKAMLEKTGLVLASKEEELTNNCFLFKFSADFIDGEKDAIQLDDKEEYVDDRLFLQKSGGVYIFGRWNRQRKDQFDFQTLEGWKDAFVKGAIVWENYVKEWERKGVFLLMNAQDRIDKRGKIATRKFGI